MDGMGTLGTLGTLDHSGGSHKRFSGEGGGGAGLGHTRAEGGSCPDRLLWEEHGHTRGTGHWDTRGAHIRGFIGVGHGDTGAKGGPHVRGFSRRLPAEPTISPRVQNAWPRKSCRIGNIRYHQGDAHPREARGAGLILHLHAWRGQGSWSPHHTWGKDM